jgi:hypothetical protein
MRMVCVLLTFVVAVSASGWSIVSDFPCPEVANEERGFGLAWRDNEVYVACWNYEEPWYTNLFVYDESGNYQGEHFPTGLTDIDISGIDWKGDADHGGMGWYGGGRQDPTMYLIADDGSSYTDFAGPTGFDRMYGVAHNPDNDILYVSDDSSGWVGWGYVDGSGLVTSWTQENVGFMYCAMKYVPAGRSNYLMAIYREYGVYEFSQLHIFTLNSNGEPIDIYDPYIIIDFGDYFYYPADFDWDGEYMWLLDQNRGGDPNTLDYACKMDIPEFGEGVVNITPASLGNIKAQFK